MCETYRFLALGDNHGDAESLRRVVEEVRGESFDYVVHTGDLTNLYFDGYAESEKQLDEMEPHLDSLAEQGEFIYVLGNRDRLGPDTLNKSKLPDGTEVPEGGFVEVGDLVFAQQAPPSDVVNKPLVRVTHYWQATPPQFEGLLSLSGDTHNGRYIGNIVDTGFLYRTSDHDANALYGGYFIIEVDSSGRIHVEFRPLGDVESRKCRQHNLLGKKFIVPKNWRNQCRFCYDEDKYYQELQLAVRDAYANEIGEPADSDLTDETLDAVENVFARPFRREERARLTSGGDDTKQSGLDHF
jgi:3',5'-cyclic AMP phosphodiesterase CpdA